MFYYTLWLKLHPRNIQHDLCSFYSNRCHFKPFHSVLFVGVVVKNQIMLANKFLNNIKHWIFALYLTKTLKHLYSYDKLWLLMTKQPKALFFFIDQANTRHDYSTIVTYKIDLVCPFFFWVLFCLLLFKCWLFPENVRNQKKHGIKMANRCTFFACLWIFFWVSFNHYVSLWNV